MLVPAKAYKPSVSIESHAYVLVSKRCKASLQMTQNTMMMEGLSLSGFSIREEEKQSKDWVDKRANALFI